MYKKILYLFLAACFSSIGLLGQANAVQCQSIGFPIFGGTAQKVGYTKCLSDCANAKQNCMGGNNFSQLFTSSGVKADCAACDNSCYKYGCKEANRFDKANPDYNTNLTRYPSDPDNPNHKK